MSVTAWLTWKWARERWLAAIPIALAVAAGVAGTMISATAAQRTSSAYADYRARAAVGDLVINPSISTKEIADVIRALPAVEHVTSDALFLTTFDEGAPRTRPEVESGPGSETYIIGSHDGRYVEMDRPILRSGRMPTGPQEAVVTVETERAHGFHVGDVVPLAFWQVSVPDGLEGEALARYDTETVAPLGVEHVRIVGVVTMHDEVLPDDVFDRQRFIVSPDIAARYDCLPHTPPPGGTLAELAKRLLPPGCATSYRYYSLALARGDVDVKPTLERFVAAANALNASFAVAPDASGAPVEAPQYFTIPTETRQDQDRIERANRPMIAALVVLSMAAAFVSVIVVALLAVREVRRTATRQLRWHQLGVGAGMRTVAVASPLIAAIVAGSAVAVATTAAVSVGPVGVVGVLEPDPGHELVGVAVLAGLATALLSASAVVMICARAARRSSTAIVPAASMRRSRRLPLPISSPAIGDGVRAAYGNRASLPVIAGLATFVAAFVAAVVFGASLTTLTSTPPAYGWPWDLAAMTGAGYGDLDVDTLERLVDEEPAVVDWSVLGFLNDVSLDGEPLTTLVGLDRFTDVELTMLDGELPRASSEVALGAATAADRGLHVGDTVELGGAGGTRSATVSGLVVFPTIGPLQAERVGAGSGVYLSAAFFDEADLKDLATFVGLDLAPDADAATIERIRERLSGLDLVGAPAITYLSPIRPPEIVDVASASTVPTTVAALFALVGAIGFGFASWASVRGRRRHLAVLQTLGFTRAQVRRSVRAQSITTAVLALAVGVPVGLVAGRVLWRLFATQLGVLAVGGVARATLLATIGGCACALVTAQIPAMVASAWRPAGGLRAE